MIKVTVHLEDRHDGDAEFFLTSCQQTKLQFEFCLHLMRYANKRVCRLCSNVQIHDTNISELQLEEERNAAGSVMTQISEVLVQNRKC